MPIPDHDELERRLGPPYKLDGSFASLWAIERILETVRRMPDWPRHVDWLKTYMADFFSAAFRDMGVDFTRTGNAFSCKNIRYAFSTDRDIPRVVSPGTKQPMFYGLYWLGAPVLNKAALPFYAYATLAQNHEWADADHDLIGRRRDHLDRVVPWMRGDTLKNLSLPPGLKQEEAEALVSAIAWPPLGFQMNEKAEYNLRNLAAVFEGISDKSAARPFLRALAASQNYFVRLPAAQFCIAQKIEPQNRDEVLAYREASACFQSSFPTEWLGIAEQFLPDDERSLEGRFENLYEQYSNAAGAGDYTRALTHLDALLQQFPGNAMFLCSRGDALTHLGRGDQALADLDAALRVSPRYWQARINRGVLHSRAKVYELADADFFAAAEIRYGDGDARNNLLCNYFFKRDGQTRAGR